MYQCLQRSKAFDFPGAIVRGGCELPMWVPNMEAGNQPPSRLLEEQSTLSFFLSFLLSRQSCRCTFWAILLSSYISTSLPIPQYWVGEKEGQRGKGV